MIKKQKKTYNNEKNGSKKTGANHRRSTSTHKQDPSKHTIQKTTRIKSPPKKKTPTSNSEAHLSLPAEDRPLVEERKEKSRISREERKAV